MKQDTDINTAALRAIAQAATPGEWLQHLVDNTTVISGTRDEICCTFYPAADQEQCEANAAHIAAFSPATALALLDELDRLRNARSRWILARRAFRRNCGILGGRDE